MNREGAALALVTTITSIIVAAYALITKGKELGQRWLVMVTLAESMLEETREFVSEAIAECGRIYNRVVYTFSTAANVTTIRDGCQTMFPRHIAPKLDDLVIASNDKKIMDAFESSHLWKQDLFLIRARRLLSQRSTKVWNQLQLFRLFVVMKDQGCPNFDGPIDCKFLRELCNYFYAGLGGCSTYSEVLSKIAKNNIRTRRELIDIVDKYYSEIIAREDSLKLTHGYNAGYSIDYLFDMTIDCHTRDLAAIKPADENLKIIDCKIVD